MSEDSGTKLVGGVAVLAGAAVFVAFLSSRVDNGAAARKLDELGYSDPTIEASGVTGGWEGCGGDELYYRAKATNSRGERVTVLLCCGAYLKGCTVRTP